MTIMLKPSLAIRTAVLMGLALMGYAVPAAADGTASPATTSLLFSSQNSSVPISKPAQPQQSKLHKKLDAVIAKESKALHGFDLSKGLVSSSPLLGNFAGKNPDILAGKDALPHSMINAKSQSNSNTDALQQPFRPYIVGNPVSLYDGTAAPSVATLAAQGSTPSLNKVGGGVAYHLNPSWNMSVDYTTGFSGSSSDQLSPNHEPTELQVVNMGMHYHF